MRGIWGASGRTCIGRMPIGFGVCSYNPESILVSESGIPSATATNHARIYVDGSNNHSTGLAIANITNSDASVEINAYESDGITPAGTSRGLIPLLPYGHSAAFADQFIQGLPKGFTGVIDISSANRFAALTLRSLVNDRGDFLMTSFPIADETQPVETPIIFPQIVDGGGYTTQFILISAGQAAGITLSHFDESGLAVDFGN